MIPFVIRRAALPRSSFVILALVLASGPAWAQSRVDFVPLGRVKLTTSTGKTRTYPTLNAAVDACTGGESIDVGVGTFALSAQLDVDQAITIRGAGRRTIISRAGVVALVTAGDVLLSDLRIVGQVTVTAGDRVAIRNVSFDATGQTHGLLIQQEANQFEGINLDIRNATSHGCFMTQCNEGIFNGCRFLSNGGDGLRIHDSGGSSVHGTPTTPNPFQPPRVVGCNASVNGGHGFAFLGVHDNRLVGSHAEQNQLAGCYFHGPIQAAVNGCYFERNNQSGAAATAAVGGVAVELFNFDGVTYQGMSASDAGSIQIHDNGFHEGYCIRVLGTTGESRRDIVSIQGNASEGFYLSGSTTRRLVYATAIRGDNRLLIIGNDCDSTVATATAVTNLIGGVEIVMNSAGSTGRNLMIAGNLFANLHKGLVLNGPADAVATANQFVSNDTAVELETTTRLAIVGGSFANNTRNISRTTDASNYAVRNVDGLPTYENPLAHYTFDDVATDSSPNVYNLTLSGSPAYADSKVNRGLNCDGDDDVGDAGTQVIPLTRGWSISCWVNYGAQSSASGSSARTIVAQGASLTNQIHLSAVRSGIADAGKIQARWSSGSPLTSTNSLADSAWHHLVFTTTQSTAKLYVDGVLDVSTGSASGTPNTGTLQLGGHDQHGDRNFLGLIDDVRIYRRELSWYDVQRLYQEFYRPDDR